MPQLSSIVDPSISLQNTQDLVRKIRFLASVRNKLIHDPTYVLFLSVLRRCFCWLY